MQTLCHAWSNNYGIQSPLALKPCWHCIVLFSCERTNFQILDFSIFCPCMEHAQAIMALQAAYFEMGMYE